MVGGDDETMVCPIEKVKHYPDVETRISTVEVAEPVYVNICCGSSARGGEVVVSEVVESSANSRVDMSFQKTNERLCISKLRAWDSPTPGKGDG